MIMLSDADLDRLFGDDNALFDAAPKDTAIVIGGAEPVSDTSQ
jgi:hypothetical protein